MTHNPLFPIRLAKKPSSYHQPAIFGKMSPPEKEFPIIMSRDAWKELVGHSYHHAIRNLGMQKVRGKKEKLKAFGFKPLEDHTLSIAQGDRGFMPLQRIKGV